MEATGFDTPATTRVTARDGVYFARIDGEGVIMDIVANRYYGLTGEAADVWQTFVEGGMPPRIPGADSPATVPPTVVSDALRLWRASNLITFSDTPSVEGHLPIAKQPRGPAACGIPGKDIRAAPRSAVIFAALIRERLRVKRSLARSGLPLTLRSIQNIRADDDVPSRRKDVLSVLHTYYVSRLPLAQGKDDCLQRSLALTSVLRRKEIDANICFGVQKFPFRAHAWVEASGLVLNETPNGIRKYTVVGRF
jgi:hypothetical protein